MGVSDLRDGFNAAAPGFTCTQAFLHYERAHDTEWQILTFRGTDAAGEPFEIRSDPIPPNGDVMVATSATAQRSVDQAAKAAADAAAKVAADAAIAQAAVDAQTAADAKQAAEAKAAADIVAAKVIPADLKALGQDDLVALNDAVDAEIKSRAAAQVVPDAPIETLAPAATAAAVDPATTQPATEGSPTP